jgi:hypothetical protein
MSGPLQHRSDTEPASPGGGVMGITFLYWEDCLSHAEALLAAAPPHHQ